MYYPWVSVKRFEITPHRIVWVGRPCKTERWARRKAKLYAMYLDHIIYLHSVGVRFGVDEGVAPRSWV